MLPMSLFSADLPQNQPYGIPMMQQGIGQIGPYGMGMGGFNPYQLAPSQGFDMYLLQNMGMGGGFNPYQQGMGSGFNPYQQMMGGGFNPYQQGMGGFNPYQQMMGGGFNPYQQGMGGFNPYQQMMGGGFNPYQQGMGGFNPSIPGMGDFNPYMQQPARNPFASMRQGLGQMPRPQMPQQTTYTPQPLPTQRSMVNVPSPGMPPVAPPATPQPAMRPNQPTPTASAPYDPQAAAKRVLEMAVRRVDPDLSFDANNDGRITAADALQVAKGWRPAGQATPTMPTMPTTPQNNFADYDQYDRAAQQAVLQTPQGQAFKSATADLDAFKARYSNPSIYAGYGADPNLAAEYQTLMKNYTAATPGYFEQQVQWKASNPYTGPQQLYTTQSTPAGGIAGIQAGIQAGMTGPAPLPLPQQPMSPQQQRYMDAFSTPARPQQQFQPTGPGDMAYRGPAMTPQQLLERAQANRQLEQQRRGMQQQAMGPPSPTSQYSLGAGNVSAPAAQPSMGRSLSMGPQQPSVQNASNQAAGGQPARLF